LQTDSDLVFGGITIVCGIAGTLAGGVVLDYMTNTLSNAFKVGIQIKDVLVLLITF